MKAVLGVLVALQVAQVGTCTVYPAPSPITPITAEVRFVDIGNGCWLLSTPTGRRYEPMQLAPEFRQEGLQVVVYYRERPDIGSVCMQRDVIQIDSVFVPRE